MLFLGTSCYSRIQVFILPHFLNQLSDDARVQNQVMEEQIVTWT